MHATNDVSSAPTYHGPSTGELAGLADAVREAWFDRCRVDAVLGQQPVPPLADEMIGALLAALGRTPSRGWDVNRWLQVVAETFARRVASLDIALRQLACLHKIVEHELPPGGVVSGVDLPLRLSALFERVMIVVAHESVARLNGEAEEALGDPLSGLGNRRAFELGFAAERARAERHQRFFSLAMIDLDRVEAINGTDAHQAVDACVQATGRQLLAVCRLADSAYRIDGDAFVVLMPETDRAGSAAFVARLRSESLPAFKAATATFPSDGFQLLDVADRRLSTDREQRGPTRMAAARVS